MTYLLHVDERLSQVVVENVGVSLFVALHGTDGHDYAVFVDAIATPVPVKLEKIKIYSTHLVLPPASGKGVQVAKTKGLTKQYHYFFNICA